MPRFQRVYATPSQAGFPLRSNWLWVHDSAVFTEASVFASGFGLQASGYASGFSLRLRLQSSPPASTRQDDPTRRPDKTTRQDDPTSRPDKTPCRGGQ